MYVEAREDSVCLLVGISAVAQLPWRILGAGFTDNGAAGDIHALEHQYLRIRFVYLAAAYVLLCSVRGVAFLGDRAGAPDYQSSDYLVALCIHDHQIGERRVPRVAKYLLAHRHCVLRAVGRLFLLESSVY